jgi:pimeloyl-ACP methyl ester carboxylesterase
MARIVPTLERFARFALNRSGMRSRWIDVGGASLHVYDGAGGGPLPPVVLLHGLSAAGSSFGRVVARVRPHVQRVIVPDLPGHGFSHHPGARQVTPDLMLDLLATGLDKIVEEPAVFYGNSLGGALAMQYAIRRPELVKALALVSPAGARVAEHEFRDVLAAFDIKNRAEARKLLDRIYHRPPWFVALFAHEFPDLMKRQAVRDILESAKVEHAPTPDELAKLAMPILLLWGRSEKLLPASALAYFKEHLPKQAVVEEPRDFGHAPQIEAPERVADRFLGFLRDVAR